MNFVARRKSREEVSRDINLVYDKYVRKRLRRDADSSSDFKRQQPKQSYHSVGRRFYWAPPEMSPEEKERIWSRMMEKPVKESSVVKLSRWQLQMEAHNLLPFYVWELFDTYKVLSLSEIVKKVNNKFRGLIDEEYVPKYLFQCREDFGEDTFFKVLPLRLRDRIIRFFKFSIPKAILSVMKFIYEVFFEPDPIFSSPPYDGVPFKKAIRKVSKSEEAFVNRRQRYKTNEQSPLWSYYQFAQDYNLYKARLISLFPDQQNKTMYT